MDNTIKSKRHKRGITREDGKRLWCYSDLYPNGEYWVSPEEYERKLENARRLSRLSAERHRERVRAKNREYGRRHRKKRCQKAVLRKFGLTPEMYQQKLESQNFVCAICKKSEQSKSQNGHIIALAVDHCHATEKIRGLLCSHCNKGLGNFKDSIETLEAAIKYLSCSRDIADEPSR